MQFPSPSVRVSVLLAIAAADAHASEGLKYVAAYRCDPLPVTRSATQICADRFPHEAGQYNSAYQTWLKRNDAEIQRLQAECKAEIRKLASDDMQFQEMMRQVNEVNAEFAAELTKHGATDMTSLCAEALADMKEGRRDLRRIFPSTK